MNAPRWVGRDRWRATRDGIPTSSQGRRIRQPTRRAAPKIWIGLAAILLAPMWGGLNAAQASDKFAGQAIYVKHCVRCHGSDGVPVVPGSPNFARGEGLLRPDTVLFERVRVGKDLMPGYAQIIRERDILNVLVYIRTLWREP